jgi:hypothetical protein
MSRLYRTTAPVSKTAHGALVRCSNRHPCRAGLAPTGPSVPPEQPGEVDGKAPAGHLRRKQPRIVRVPPTQFRPSDGRAPPVIGDAEKRAGSRSHEESVLAHYGCATGESRRSSTRMPHEPDPHAPVTHYSLAPDARETSIRANQPDNPIAENTARLSQFAGRRHSPSSVDDGIAAAAVTA